MTDITGTTVWFDAEQITGLTDGNALSLWEDLSGNDYDLSQNTPDNQPTYRDGANGLNGRPVVQFDGTVAASGDRMNTFEVPTSNDFTAILVWTMTSGSEAGSQIPFAKFNQAGKREWAYWWDVSTPQDRMNTSTSANGASRTNRVYTDIQPPTTDYVVDMVVKGGADAPLVRDGVTTVGMGGVHETLGVVSGSPANSPISVGTSFGATTNHLTGSIAEAIVYNRALNGGERIVVQNYLAAKWGRGIDAAEDLYTGDDIAKGDYDADVIGIGQAAGGKLATSHGSGLRVSELGATLDADGEFVLAGHKTATNALVTDDIGGISGLTERWSRVWYVDGTGDAGAQVMFDFSDTSLPAPVDGQGFSLIYSATGAFNFSVLATTNTVDNGDEVSFDLASGFADGYYTLALGIGSTAIIGDVNHDGTVDIFDVNVVSDNWGDTGAPGIPGDANHDGTVDIFDVNTISDHWGEGGGGVATVPEPTTWSLGALALVAMGAIHRIRRTA